MSQSVQNVTLALTLPISCQICLGKVRKPVICCNNHVFCSACIDIWLQKCSQCPTCRVSITPQNPCREIIGALNESEYSESHSVRKHLRKTRGELLLREYEEELENLQKENEELRNKTVKMEAELRAAQSNSTVSVTGGLETQSETVASVDSALLEETTNKLRAASELYLRVTQDVDKLRDANKTLRSQNVDLIQENVRLRAEVDSRSPQKFGRFTVAALEAKISKCDREMTQLKKALERSDKYIEELELQVSKYQKDPQLKSTSSENKALEGVTTDSSPDQASLYLFPTSDEASKPKEEKIGIIVAPSTPTTPSSALEHLNLKSPAAHTESNSGFNRLPYFRRLSFEDCASTNSLTLSSKTNSNNQKATAWCTWNLTGGFTSGITEAQEASMNAAFLDKVSELDSLMSEGESSNSQTLRISLPKVNIQTDPKSAEEQQDSDPGIPETTEPIKRKCYINIAKSSPSKVSKIK